MASENPPNSAGDGDQLATFGESLKLLRERLDLNQKKLADICGVRRQTVGNWLSGQTAPTVEHLMLLQRWCRENNKRMDFGDLFGEPKADWGGTPLAFTIELLQDMDRLGIRGVYRNRHEALAAFAPFIATAQSICITSSSLLGIRVAAPDDVPTALREKAGEVPFRILMTDPAFSKLREEQEDRLPGTIKGEIHESVRQAIRWGVSKDSIRFFRGAPTVFMICTPERMVVNGYTYSTEAYKTFAFSCAPTSDRSARDVYRQYKESHFDQPWDKGISVDEALPDLDQ